MIRLVLGVAALSAGLAQQARAQSPVFGGGHGLAGEAVRPPPRPGLPELDITCDAAEELGGTDLERAAWCAAAPPRAEYVSARTLADKALAADERSFRAHFVMGYVQHLGEGNLPKALYHLERAEALFIESYGQRPSLESSPWRVYHRILRELIYVHGEMDHHEAKIAYVEALNDRLGLDYRPLAAWPLLKLKRFDEARAIAKAASEADEHWSKAVGMTALCAIESELRNRQGAYEACTDAARPVQRSAVEGAIELSNAGAAAEEVFRFDEAERYYAEAARRPPEGSVNPWGRLVRLYLRQGRYAEAVSGWREMRAYRARRPGSYLDQQDQSDAELIGASVLILGGRAAEAERITDRTVKRPDRQGTSSATAEQNEAGAAITDRVAKLEAARALEEEASSAPWREKLGLRYAALKLRFQAWVVGRKAAEALADRERLVSSLRPECPGSIEAPVWLDAEVVRIVGPGVALAAIREGRAEETLPAEHAEPIFQGLEAEAHLLAGSWERALEAARFVIEKLPASEALLRARSAAVGAEAAWRLGETEEALRLFKVVLATDPGFLRRLGHRLPVVLVAAEPSPAVERALALLKRSPRFEEEPWGFVLEVSQSEVGLGLQDGSVLTSIRVPAGRSEDDEASARRIVRAIHRELLVPGVDVTQADIRSLDGALGGGGRASEHVRGLLEEILEPPPEAPRR